MSSSSRVEFVDYYELLGIKPTAEIHEIRRAFILRAKQHHPDAGGSTETMQRLNSAYRTLASSTSKASYDLMHNFHIGNTKPSDYRYSGGREVNDVTDMTDTEIDSFLDELFTEYRQGPPTRKQGLRLWFKKLFV
jgi:curved DNA-binding protein CbpA